LEQRTREEAEETRITWNTGAYYFLLTRTQEKYELKSITTRRIKLERQLNLTLPKINDEMLKALYEFACIKYMKSCQQRYGFSSGFGRTRSEEGFSKTLESIIQNHPKLKHLEVYPSQKYSTDLSPDFKMVVGNYVPDFIIFGLKIKKSSAVVIEIDGDSHIDKWHKDELRNNHLRQQKLFTFEVQNGQVSDLKFITEALLKMYRLRNGSFNQQILRAKRHIWVKTICCQLRISEIEDLVQKHFSVQLNLKEETQAIKSQKDCPRIIRNEITSNKFY
jgi:very-short-patch-repair endonuclease